MYKAVIFDMDGVLVNSQSIHYETDMAVLQKAGHAAQLTDVTPYAGIANHDRWPKYRESLNLEPSAETLIEWQTALIEENFTKLPLESLPGISELLAHIADRKLPAAVGSASQPALIDLVLRKLDIAHYFQAVVSCEDVARGKPAPDVFLAAAEKLGIAPRDCIVVEDAPAGVQAAKNADMACIAFRSPHTLAQDFSLADYVVDHFAECIKWL